MQSDFNHNHISAEEITLLAQWLDTMPNAMRLPELEGYMFALICAPAPTDNETWLKQALATDLTTLTDDQLFALLALYNHFSEQVYETGYRLPEVENAAVDPLLHFSANDKQHLWSKGFAQGVDYAQQLLSCEAIDIEQRSAFAMAINCLSFYADEQVAIEQAEYNQMTLAEYTHVVNEMRADFAAGFAQLVETLAVNSGLFDDEEWEDEV